MVYQQHFEHTESKFNPASYKMERIGKINEVLVNIKLAPFDYNEQTHDYNYKAWLTCLICLAIEGDAKFSPTEKEDIAAYQKAIEHFVEHNQVVSESPVNNDIVINKQRWNILRNHLLEFEKMVKLALDKHGLDTPNKRAAGLF